MHDLNEEFGYDDVSGLIGLVGNALTDATRNEKERRIKNHYEGVDRRRKDRRQKNVNDVVVRNIGENVCRLHNDAGDEFFIEGYFKNVKEAVNLAQEQGVELGATAEQYERAREAARKLE
jgi:hypothetical protein